MPAEVCRSQGVSFSYLLPKSARTFRYHVENLVERNLVKASGMTADRVYELVVG